MQSDPLASSSIGSLAAERCDQLLLLRDGQLIAAGTPDELRARTGEQGLDAVFLRLVEESA